MLNYFHLSFRPSLPSSRLPFLDLFFLSYFENVCQHFSYYLLMLLTSLSRKIKALRNKNIKQVRLAIGIMNSLNKVLLQVYTEKEAIRISSVLPLAFIGQNSLYILF